MNCFSRNNNTKKRKIWRKLIKERKQEEKQKQKDK